MNESKPELIETKTNESGQIIQTIYGPKSEDRSRTGTIHYSKVALSGIHEWSIKCENMGLNDVIGISSSLKNVDVTSSAWLLGNHHYFWYDFYYYYC